MAGQFALEEEQTRSVTNGQAKMDNPQKTIQTVVLASPCAGTSTSFAILDVLSSVGRDWELLHGKARQPPLFVVSFLSLNGKAYQDANGRTVTPEGTLTNCPQPDLIIVPDLHLDPAAALPDEFLALAAWVNEHYERGALVTSVCSGTLLLAAAGLLDGIEATTHWGYADMLTQRFPQVKLRAERILVPAGEGHRLITAGGASAWADLMLYLIARLAGTEEARQVAKVYLLEPHSSSQLCYASLTVGRQHDDQLIAAAQVWVAEHYDTPNPVNHMVSRSALSERSFLRRFRRATGQSPSEYVQTLRVEEAKQMLETTSVPIDRIALEVGYTEPSSFRAAFRKHVGISASAYRKKWCSTLLREIA